MLFRSTRSHDYPFFLLLLIYIESIYRVGSKPDISHWGNLDTLEGRGPVTDFPEMRESYPQVGHGRSYPLVLEIARTLLSSIDLPGRSRNEDLRHESLLLEATRDRNQY